MNHGHPRTAIRLTRVLAVALLLASCTASGDEAPPISASTTATTPSTSVAPTTSSTATTATSAPQQSTTIPSSLPPPPGVEALTLTPYSDAPLEWVKADVAFDRDREHWLGVVGDEFVMMSWRFPVFGFTIRRSGDGLSWSDELAISGLPEAGWVHSIKSAGAGMIAAFEIAGVHGEESSHEVFTSTDGAAWTRQPADGFDSGFDAVAASDAGFAIVTSSNDAFPTRSLYVESVDGSWEQVELQDYERHLYWITGIGDEFVAKGPENVERGSGSVDRAYTYYVIDADGSVELIGVPTEYDPIDWNGAMLVPGGHGPTPLMVTSPDAIVWQRLPFPAEVQYPDGFWAFETLSAGPMGIVGAGCDCGDFWEFYGDSFLGIYVEAGGYQINIDGDRVWIGDGEFLWDSGLYTPDFRVDTAEWFADRTGTLTVPHPETGATLAEITCDEIRDAVHSGGFQWQGFPIGDFGSDGQLIAYPEVDELWFSPDGTSWDGKRVADIFGDGSYVFQTATHGSTAISLVAPNGAREVADPPGCPLGLFPEEEPYEIWVAHVP